MLAFNMFKYWPFVCLSIGLLYVKVSGLQLIKCNQYICSDFSTKTYAVGTQNNRFIETVLLSTKTHVKLDG